MLRPTIADLIANSEKLREKCRKVREQSKSVKSVESSWKETVDHSLAERLIQEERSKLRKPR